MAVLEVETRWSKFDDYTIAGNLLRRRKVNFPGRGEVGLAPIYQS